MRIFSRDVVDDVAQLRTVRTVHHLDTHPHASLVQVRGIIRSLPHNFQHFVALEWPNPSNRDVHDWIEEYATGEAERLDFCLFAFEEEIDAITFGLAFG